MRRKVWTAITATTLAVASMPVELAAASPPLSLPAGETTVHCQQGRLSVRWEGGAAVLSCRGRHPTQPVARAVTIPAASSRRATCADGSRPGLRRRAPSQVVLTCPTAPPPLAPPMAPNSDYPWPGHISQVAPDGRRICTPEVHDRYSVVIEGIRYATWHPPIDPVTGCAFGHEHGSDPSRWAHAHVLDGPITFGRVNTVAGVSEPHAGFKVYAVDRDRHGLGWLVVLHQGSAGPRRAQVRHHSLEVWMVGASTGTLLARTSVMADFGDYVPNCTPAEVQRLGPAFAPRNPHAVAQRAIPAPQCESVYEQWVTQLDVGGFFGGRPGFDIDNAITQVDPLDPNRVLFNKRAACGPFDPAGWDSYCKGDKRNVVAPGWWLRPGSPGWFRTDVYGRRDPNGALVQWVEPSASHQAPWSADCCGPDNVLTMTDPTTGIYRPGAEQGTNFEGPQYCVLRWN